MLHSSIVSDPTIQLTNLSMSPENRREKQAEVYKRKKSIKEALANGHKLCTSCNETKSLSDFNVDKKTFTGYSTWCKDCKRTYNKKYLKGYSDDSSLR